MKNNQKFYMIFMPIIAVVVIGICILGMVACSDVPEERPIERYDVISTHLYQHVDTSSFGKVGDVEIKYYFSYLDADGHLKHVDEFEHSGRYEYVEIGEKNEYVVDMNNNTKVLYLTKETLENLSVIQH